MTDEELCAACVAEVELRKAACRELRRAQQPPNHRERYSVRIFYVSQSDLDDDQPLI